MTQRRIPRCLPLGGLAIMIAATLLLALWGAVQAATPEPPRRDIIVLLDNSGTMMLNIPKLDPDGYRMAFTRFLVRVLQTLAPEQTEQSSVGVALFGRKVALLAPSGVMQLSSLRSVRDWTAADIASMQSFTCPDRNLESGNYDRTKDFCYGTNYRAALDWAQEQFEVVSDKQCGTAERKCYILLFTDGKLINDVDSDTYEPAATDSVSYAEYRSALGEQNLYQGLARLEESLNELAKRKISLSVGLFSQNGKISIKCTDCWQTWNEQKIGNQEKIDFLDVYEANPQAAQLFDTSLQVLGLAHLLRDFQRVDSNTYRVDLPSRLAYVRLQILDGGDGAAGYTVATTPASVPSLDAGIDKWWYAPTFSVLTVTSSGAEPTYLRIISEPITSTMPVNADLNVFPSIGIEGDSIIVQAYISAGSIQLDNDAVRGVWVAINLGHEGNVVTRTLDYHEPGIWKGQIERLAAGDHLATLHMDFAGWEPIDITGELTQTLQLTQIAKRKLLVDVQPDKPLAMWPFDINVMVLDGNKLVDLPDPAKMTLTTDEGGNPISLERIDHGIWRGVGVFEHSSEHAITITTQANTPDPLEPYHAKLDARPAPRPMVEVVEAKAPISGSEIAPLPLSITKTGGVLLKISLPGPLSGKGESVQWVEVSPGPNPWVARTILVSLAFMAFASYFFVSRKTRAGIENKERKELETKRKEEEKKKQEKIETTTQAILGELRERSEVDDRELRILQNLDVEKSDQPHLREVRYRVAGVLAKCQILEGAPCSDECGGCDSK